MSLAWTTAYVVESAPATLNDGDKVILPASALEDLLRLAGNDSERLPSPLTFEIRHPHSRAIVHGGVKEFSSQGDTVQLPAWMLENLQIEQGARVIVKLRELPKGTWTRLRPLSSDYNDILDYRAALEAHLRAHYNTLTEGQILSCRYGGKSYPFLVAELKPESAVGITDTDLEVDIESPEAAASLTHTAQHINADRTVLGLDERIGGVGIPKDEYKYWRLLLGDATQVTIELQVDSGNADLVVDNVARRPTLENHTWASLTSESDRQLVVSGVEKEIYIGIHAFQEAVVSWRAVKGAVEEMETVEAAENANQPGYVQCTNCQAWIPERTRVLHENFCLRNNVVCAQGCGRVFKKDSPELQDHWHCDACDTVSTVQNAAKHTAYQHTPKTCVCGQFTAESFTALAAHRRSDCPERLITCRYCHNLVAQGVVSLDARDRLLRLHSHESYCGSRTIACQKCHKQIPIKDIQVHAKIHDIERQNQKLPDLCANQNCVRARAANRLGLCQYCFGPFWTTDDDPKNVKLIQRVARKLHAQLTVGCGKTWCRNKYCATATGEPKEANAAATTLIPLLQNVQREVGKPIPRPNLYLCVDETVTRKRFLSETLQEGVQGKYTFAWCAKALENENEDLERARIWLERNAPRQSVKST